MLTFNHRSDSPRARISLMCAVYNMSFPEALMALLKHAPNGPEAFNAVRALDTQFVQWNELSLQGIDLTGVNLKGVAFKRCNLLNTNLLNARLSKTTSFTRCALSVDDQEELRYNGCDVMSCHDPHARLATGRTARRSGSATLRSAIRCGQSATPVYVS